MELLYTNIPHSKQLQSLVEKYFSLTIVPNENKLDLSLDAAVQILLKLSELQQKGLVIPLDDIDVPDGIKSVLKGRKLNSDVFSKDYEWPVFKNEKKCWQAFGVFSLKH